MNLLKQIPGGSIILLLFITVSNLAGQSEEQIARFEEEKIAFFTKELQLTDAEAEKFWPLYNDFSNRFMKLAEEERNTLRYFHSNQENMSNEEVSELLDKYLDITNQKHKLEVEYHKKFKEILPEKKVMMLYVAERQFRMHLIRKLKNPGQEPGQGPGSGPGSKGRNDREPGGGAGCYPAIPDLIPTN